MVYPYFPICQENAYALGSAYLERSSNTSTLLLVITAGEEAYHLHANCQVTRNRSCVQSTKSLFLATYTQESGLLMVKPNRH